eukprot:scaffold37576_cov72-Phaeocystis_antarctica.AAC.5
MEAATTACAAETAAAVSDDAARSLEALADAACFAASSLKLAPERVCANAPAAWTHKVKKCTTSMWNQEK